MENETHVPTNPFSYRFSTHSHHPIALEQVFSGTEIEHSAHTDRIPMKENILRGKFTL